MCLLYHRKSDLYASEAGVDKLLGRLNYQKSTEKIYNLTIDKKRALC
jgi:hypothetical protein